MSRVAFPPEEAVDLVMKGFIVSDPSGSVLARARSRYLMRRADKRIDLPIEGMSREALLAAWVEFNSNHPEQASGTMREAPRRTRLLEALLG
ncbi:MAG: hypothetical protein J0H19_00365 [Rhodospirillales bacterium]|nr:hypothetical protein [Rhodospirillales bacterium]MBN8908004.1 hypothetical protein [Rhodospirillales bacterium]MBN8925055.1 hypothetical protein [Rhodospirillales bacterium]